MERDARRALIRSAAIGTLLQVGVVVTGHYSGGGGALRLRRDGHLAGGGGTVRPVVGEGDAAGGGAVAGAVCALPGIALSVSLGDVPASLLAFGTISSAVTGAIGGAAGWPRGRAGVA